MKAGAKTGAISAQQATVDQPESELLGQLQVQRQGIARIEAQYAGDRSAQTATVQRLATELKTAEAELERYKSLYDEGAVSMTVNN